MNPSFDFNEYKEQYNTKLNIAQTVLVNQEESFISNFQILQELFEYSKLLNEYYIKKSNNYQEFSNIILYKTSLFSKRVNAPLTKDESNLNDPFFKVFKNLESGPFFIKNFKTLAAFLTPWIMVVSETFSHGFSPSFLVIFLDFTILHSLKHKEHKIKI